MVKTDTLDSPLVLNTPEWCLAVRFARASMPAPASLPSSVSRPSPPCPRFSSYPCAAVGPSHALSPEVPPSPFPCGLSLASHGSLSFGLVREYTCFNVHFLHQTEHEARGHVQDCMPRVSPCAWHVGAPRTAVQQESRLSRVLGPSLSL